MKILGASPSTKFLFPMEFTSLLAPVKKWLTEGAEGEGGK
jgi:hypothetical protein